MRFKIHHQFLGRLCITGCQILQLLALPDASIEKLGRLVYFCKIGFGLSLLLHREVVNFIKLDAGVREKKKIKQKKKSRADAFLSAGRCEGQRLWVLFGDTRYAFRLQE